MTQVLPERQKILFKGKAITESWEGVKLKNNMTFLMMGSVGEVVSAPAVPTTFIENLAEDELVGASKLPPGLKNFGNTCYLNSTIQSLHKIPDLKQAIASAEASGALNGGGMGMMTNQELTKRISQLFTTMDDASNDMEVDSKMMKVWEGLKAVNPTFGSMSHGQYEQQDAIEAWNQLLNTIKGATGEGQSPIDNLMGIQLQVKYTCDENPEETKTKTEREMMLNCFIDKKLGHLNAGLQRGFEGEMVMQSQTLTNSEGSPRDAVFSKSTKIDRLPAYLAIQFNRFMMKNGNQPGERVQCKIGKAMKFSLELDMVEFCSEELLAKITPQRDNFEQARDEEIERGQNADAGAVPKKDEDIEFMPHSFEDDPGSNNSGYYELIAVVTHEGRTANSGHYVAWARVDKDTWACYNDDKVTTHNSERVIKLSGESGADSPTAYMCIYGPKCCPKLEGSAKKAKVEEEGATAAAAAPMDTN